MSTTSSIAMPSSERVPYFDTIIRVVLGIYIAVLPFKSLLVVERNGFILLLGLLVVWCVVNRRLFYVRTPYDMLLLAFVVWVGFTIPFSVAPLYSLKEYGKLLQHMVVFYALVYFLRDTRFARILPFLIGTVTIIVAGYGLTQFNLIDGQAVKSFLPSEVWLTTFLIMVFPFVFAAACGSGPQGIKRFAALTSAMVACCLLITQSRAGLVAFFVELWVVVWLIRSLRAKIVAGIVTACMIAVVLFAFKMDMSAGSEPLKDARASVPVRTSLSSVLHRFDIWGFTLSEIAKHGLVGIGYGGHSYFLVYGQEQEAPGQAPIKRAGTHNIFLYLALHAGVPAMLLFAWLYYSLIVTTAREYWVASEWMQRSVLAGMVGSLVGMLSRLQFDQMFVGSLAVFFWVLVAMAVLSYPSYNQAAEETRVRRFGALTEV